MTEYIYENTRAKCTTHREEHFEGIEENDDAQVFPHFHSFEVDKTTMLSWLLCGDYIAVPSVTTLESHMLIEDFRLIFPIMIKMQ